MPVKRAAAGPSKQEKRTRFADSPGGSSADGAGGDDDFLEADLPENAQEEKRRSKKKLRDTDGYGSDSSNDEEGVVPSRRPGAEAEDEDMDMFASDNESKAAPAADKGKGKGKGKEFMDLNDVEGQEFGKASGGVDEDSDSEEEMEEEYEDEMSGERARRKKNKEKDLGIEVTPFNMKGEMEEGRFTADGEAYVANDRDPNEKHDVWLDDVEKDAIRKARRAHRERERLEKEREERESGAAGMQERKEKETQLMREAVEYMQRGETVLEALQRLGAEAEEKRKKDEAASGKKKSWAEKQKERKAVMAGGQDVADPVHTSNPFTNFSNIVSGLTTVGHLDVYSLSREAIQRMLPQAPPPSAPAPSAAPPPPKQDTRQFQYRFSMAYVRNLPEAQRPVERELFGPFSLSQLQAWRGTGFFGSPACENIEVRALEEGGSPSDWGSWADIVKS